MKVSFRYIVRIISPTVALSHTLFSMQWTLFIRYVFPCSRAEANALPHTINSNASCFLPFSYIFFFIILFSFSFARLILRENVTTKKNISNLFNEYIMEWPEWTRGLSVTSVNSITSAPRLSVNRSICASRRSFFFFFFFFFFHWHSTCLAFVSPTR